MSEGITKRDDGNSLIKAYVEQGRGLESAINLYNDTADKYDEVMQATQYFILVGVLNIPENFTLKFILQKCSCVVPCLILY